MVSSMALTAQLRTVAVISLVSQLAAVWGVGDEKEKRKRK